MNRQIVILEEAGWYQEHYRVMAERFDAWNWDVWNGRWQLQHAQCVLCLSEGPCITGNTDGNSLCLLCLNEMPEVAWHPTGTVRPKVSDLLAIEQRRRQSSSAS